MVSPSVLKCESLKNDSMDQQHMFFPERDQVTRRPSKSFKQSFWCPNPLLLEQKMDYRSIELSGNKNTHQNHQKHKTNKTHQQNNTKTNTNKQFKLNKQNTLKKHTGFSAMKEDTRLLAVHCNLCNFSQICVAQQIHVNESSRETDPPDLIQRPIICQAAQQHTKPA